MIFLSNMTPASLIGAHTSSPTLPMTSPRLMAQLFQCIDLENLEGLIGMKGIRLAVQTHATPLVLGQLALGIHLAKQGR